MPNVTLTNSSWLTVRDIDVSGGAPANEDFPATNDVAGARATGVAGVEASRGEMGDLASMGIMVTVLDANGKPDNTGFGTTLNVTVIQITPVDNATLKSKDQRVAVIETVAFGSNTQGIEPTSVKIPRGEYALQVDTVALLPGGATRMIISARMI